MRNRPLLILATAALSAPAAAQDPDLKQAVQKLAERVDELEEQSLQTAEKVGGRAHLQAFTAKSLDVGGHVSSLFTWMNGEEDSEAGHLVTLVELILRAQVDDHWSLFAAPGFYVFNGGLLDNPATVTITGDPAFVEDEASDASLFLSRVYAQYTCGDRLTVRGGIFGSPHGTTNREYYVPSRVIAEGSLHTRYFLANQLYPQQVMGLGVSGKEPLGGSNACLEWDAYFGTEDDSAADGIGGARVAYALRDVGLSVGVDYGRGTREGFPIQPLTSPTPLYTGNVNFIQAPFPGRFNLTRDYEFAGLDVHWDHGDFANKTELYYSAEEGVADQLAFSTELNWFFHPQWAVSYRFDWYDAGADLDALGSAVMELGHASEHVAGLCYQPHEAVRVRLDVHHLLLPRTDDTIDFVNLSWSVSF